VGRTPEVRLTIVAPDAATVGKKPDTTGGCERIASLAGLPMSSYRHATGVEPMTLDGRPVFGLPRGGRVAADGDVMTVWRAAADRSLDGVASMWPSLEGRREFVPAALACLAEGGLLQRGVDDRDSFSSRVESRHPSPLVSAVIISYESLDWLDGSIR